MKTTRILTLIKVSRFGNYLCRGIFSSRSPNRGKRGVHFDVQTAEGFKQADDFILFFLFPINLIGSFDANEFVTARFFFRRKIAENLERNMTTLVFAVSFH